MASRRTVGDSRVRPEHAALEGDVREWNDSPDPGEEFNCRCWAEKIMGPLGLVQRVTSPTTDSDKKWTWVDFVHHFYSGNGQAVDLSQIGLLKDTVSHAEMTVFRRVEDQIERLAQSVVDGDFRDTFSRSYDFGSVSFSLGNSTINGRISGVTIKDEKILIVEANVEYLFFDQFTDPLSIREKLGSGTSSSDKADRATDVGGTAYDIIGRWLTKVTGTVKAPE